jgi:hypothetical protein
MSRPRHDNAEWPTTTIRSGSGINGLLTPACTDPPCPPTEALDGRDKGSRLIGFSAENACDLRFLGERIVDREGSGRLSHAMRNLY